MVQLALIDPLRFASLWRIAMRVLRNKVALSRGLCNKVALSRGLCNKRGYLLSRIIHPLSFYRNGKSEYRPHNVKSKAQMPTLRSGIRAQGQ